MTTIEKVEIGNVLITVFGSVNGQHVEATGPKWNYTNAKSLVHAQRYAEQLLVAEAGKPGTYPPRPEHPDTGFPQFPTAVYDKLKELEDRIAKLENTWWQRLKKYFGFDQK